VELEADGPAGVYAVTVEERDRSPGDERCRSRQKTELDTGQMMKTPCMSVPHLCCLRVSLAEESVEPLRGLVREVEKMGHIRPKLSVRFSSGEWRGM
jgi:hypothetical protein